MNPHYLREAEFFAKFAICDSFTHFATFAPNSAALRKCYSPHVALKVFDIYRKDLQRLMFGKRYYRIKDNKISYSPLLLGSSEHVKDDNYHFHMLLKICPSTKLAFELCGEMTFRRQFPAATVKIDTLLDKPLVERTIMALYPFKHLINEENRDRLIVSPGINFSKFL